MSALWLLAPNRQRQTEEGEEMTYHELEKALAEEMRLSDWLETERERLLAENAQLRVEVEEEREACAQVADSYRGKQAWAYEIAEAIRARTTGEKK